MIAAAPRFAPQPSCHMHGTLGMFGSKRDDSTPTAANELHGAPDGPPLVLSNGIVVQPKRIGDARVTRSELFAAVAGIRRLPEADQRLIADHRVPIELLPVAALEDGLLGATTIVQQHKHSPNVPTLVRVAVRANLPGAESTPEIVQHELGHVLAVLRRQDLTEHAAEVYAAQY